MNEAGILHIPDSRYCFAIDQNEVVIRIRTPKRIETHISILYMEKI